MKFFTVYQKIDSVTTRNIYFVQAETMEKALDYVSAQLGARLGNDDLVVYTLESRFPNGFPAFKVGNHFGQVVTVHNF